MKTAVAIGGSAALAACTEREEMPDVPQGPSDLSSLPERQHGWNDHLSTDASDNRLAPAHNVVLLLDYAGDDRPTETDRETLETALQSLERHDVTRLEAVDTADLINLYTLLSDVQRGANDFRKEVTDVLLARLHHDRPVYGQYGSVQRTTRRRREFKDDEEVLAALEDAGIDRERVLGVDRDKVDDALEVTELSESDVYEIEEREYVRKAEVNEDVKGTRLQGLKDRLAATEREDAEALRREIEDLEQQIDDLTSFSAGRELA